MAVENLFGTWEESFKILYRFKAEVELRCPGSVVEIAVKEDNGQIFFDKFFCCLKPCIDGFLNGCRPFLSVDSTALNGRWNGHLAAATTLDGHNWMFPVAFGFFDAGTSKNWTWFFEQLQKAIGNPPVLSISSDACKGLENAVKKVYPWAEHRECFRHLMQNFRKRYRGPVFGNMYPAARARRADKYQHYISIIHEANQSALAWVNKNHKLLWARSKFLEEIKCAYINNNLAECFNKWVKDIEDLPICELADTLRSMIMELFEKRRRIGERLQGTMIPTLVSQLKAMTRGFGHLKVIKGARDTAEVVQTTIDQGVVRHVVDLQTKACTCRE